MGKIFSPIKTRLLKYLEYKGISRDFFCRTTGISASNFKGVGLKSELGGDRVAKILTTYADLNSDWLLTGRGEMLSGEPVAVVYPSDGANSGVIHDVSACYVSREVGAVPVYELDSATGLEGLFSGTGKVVGRIVLPDLPPCDGALYVRGDSMFPLLKGGDVVVYKEVGDVTHGILWGEMYLISFEADGGKYISIRYIQRGADAAYVRLVSHNPLHSPQDIPLLAIRALALIKASVRYNTMG